MPERPSNGALQPQPTPKTALISEVLASVGGQLWPADRDGRGGGPPRVHDAASAFDSRHGARLSFADRVHAAVYFHPSDLLKRAAFDEALREVRFNRFFLKEKLEERQATIARGPRRRRWKIENSIWAPRPKSCDSADFVNTAACCRAMFEVEWGQAVAAGMARYIEKNDDGDEAEDMSGRSPAAFEARRAAEEGTEGETEEGAATPVATPVATADAGTQHTQRPGQLQARPDVRSEEAAVGDGAERGLLDPSVVEDGGGGGLGGAKMEATGVEEGVVAVTPRAINRVAPPASPPGRGVAASGAVMIVGEVEQVAVVMWQHYQLICSLFDYYSAIGSSEDIFHIMFNAWGQFVSDFGLVGSNAWDNVTAWDSLFIAVDAAAARAAGKQVGGKNMVMELAGAKQKALERAEFLHCLVRAAVMRYIHSRVLADVSQSVQRLFTEIISPCAERAQLFMSADTYRRAQLYVEEVDTVLRRHEAALRKLFHATCALLSTNNSLANKHVSYPRWKMFVSLFNLVSIDCTERDATLCFSSARMFVIDAERDNRSAVRRTHLGFEDFLEALCRVAGLKSFPTDEELLEAGSENAGTHLLKLASENEDEYKKLLRERAAPWGSPPSHQPLARCVEHLCHMLIVHCQGGLKRTATDFLLTDAQVKWGFNGNRSLS